MQSGLLAGNRSPGTRLAMRQRRRFCKIHGFRYSCGLVRGKRMLLGQHATLAQSVERLTRNEQVDSSILSSGSITARLRACCFAVRASAGRVGAYRTKVAYR